MRNELYSNTQDYINRWVISYADFITMLLALFMVMYALTQIDANNIKGFSNSVGKAFDISGNEQASQKFKNIDNLERKRELLKIFSTTETAVIVNNVNIDNQKTQINHLKNEIRNFEKDIDKESVEFSNIEKLIKIKVGNIDALSMTRESRGLVIRLKDNLFFDPGSDIIKGKAQATLDELAGVLKEVPNSVKIEGHTDNRPINTAKFPSNWELSTARAVNIVKYLVNYHKFNPNKLSAVGYGEYMPLKDNLSKENQAANRRVDIVVLSSTSKIFEPGINKVGKEQLRG